MLSMTECSSFLGSLLEGQAWREQSLEQRQRALASAELAIRGLNFRGDPFSLESLPVEIRHAIYLQALYLLINKDGLFYSLAEMNGWKKVSAGEFSADLGKRSFICLPAKRLLKRHLQGVGKFI